MLGLCFAHLLHLGCVMVTGTWDLTHARVFSASPRVPLHVRLQEAAGTVSLAVLARSW